MRISIEWLKEFVSFDLSTEELSNALLKRGIGVEGLERWGEDWILILEVTPNRPDLLSMFGIARELSVLTGNPLRLKDTRVEETGDSILKIAKVTVEDPEDCPRYAARVLTGVKVKPSPPWIQERLEKSGLRSVNNIVDATNYTLLERGHPLHAFDYDKLSHQKIHVRRAEKGEVLTTLDGVKRDLAPEILLICDGKGPIALAGVMGGADTEISESSTKVLIESAYFHASLIRRGAKILGLTTEASYRFERRADIEELLPSLDRASSLMVELAGGEVAKGVIDFYPHPSSRVTIPLRMNRIREILGISIEEDDVRKILTRLGFEIETPKSPITNYQSPITVSVPSFRRDCHREIDLIEELARVHGYEAIPSHLARGGRFVGRTEAREKWIKEMEETLVGSGFTQISTIPLQSPDDLLRTLWRETSLQPLQLRNPLTMDLSLLQTSLLPSVLRTLERNQRTGFGRMRIFEIGKVYLKNEKGMEENLSLLLALVEESGNLNGFSSLKGLLESLFKKFGLEGIEWSPLKTDLFTPQSSLIDYEGETLGILGVLKEKRKEDFELKGEVVLGELNLERFLERIPRETFFNPLPKFPPIDRDLSCIVEENIPSEKVVHLLRKGGEDLLEEVRFLDHYKGDPIPKGKKSLTYALRFRSRERTLMDREVDRRVERIIELLEKDLKGEIRKKG